MHRKLPRNKKVHEVLAQLKHWYLDRAGGGEKKSFIERRRYSTDIEQAQLHPSSSLDGAFNQYKHNVSLSGLLA